MDEARTTTDHDVIRRWAEERGGMPAAARAAKPAASLCIDFPGREAAERPDRIDWDDFFQKFESGKLAFLYRDRTRDGRLCRFSKFIVRDAEGELTARPARPRGAHFRSTPSNG